MRAEEAFELLVNYLAQVAPSTNIHGQRRGNRGADLYLPDLVRSYLEPQVARAGNFIAGIDAIPEAMIIPFYDAAWDLCRLGVLRPGSFAPMGQGHPAMFGDHYVITAFGAGWLKEASQRAFLDPTRLGETLTGFARRFGDAYAQRAAEAVKSYRSQNWLATCVMSGAAAESILLAVAVAKTKDEATVLATYNSAKGRIKITRLAVEGVSPSIKQTFETALGVLQYWRDDAAHGVVNGFAEAEAHESLSRLLRLAQFVDKNWSKLIKPTQT